MCTLGAHWPVRLPDIWWIPGQWQTLSQRKGKWCLGNDTQSWSLASTCMNTHVHTHTQLMLMYTEFSSSSAYTRKTSKTQAEACDDTTSFFGVLWVNCTMSHSAQFLISRVWISGFLSSSQMCWYFCLTVDNTVWQEGKSMEWQREKSRCFGHRKSWIWGHTNPEENIWQ